MELYIWKKGERHCAGCLKPNGEFVIALPQNSQFCLCLVCLRTLRGLISEDSLVRKIEEMGK